MTKSQKQLVAGIAAAAALIAVLLTVFLLASRPKREQAFEITREEETGQIQLAKLQTGAEENPDSWDLPLPLYRFSPTKEWYSRLRGAEENANLLSYRHQDIYRNAPGELLYFSQQIAVKGQFLPAEQEAWFGDCQVIYAQQTDGQGKTSTTIYWVHDDSLLSFVCTTDKTLNEMLELVSRVDYQSQRTPSYSVLSLMPCIERGGVRLPYRSSGNPEIPVDYQFLAFSQPPEGYTADISYNQSNNSFPLDHITLGYCDQEKNQLTLDCWLGDNGSTIGEGFQGGLATETDPYAYQPVQIKGNPGYYYVGENSWELAWTQGYCTLQLISQTPMTSQQLLALAELVEPIDDVQVLLQGNNI